MWWWSRVCMWTCCNLLLFLGSVGFGFPQRNLLDGSVHSILISLPPRALTLITHSKCYGSHSLMLSYTHPVWSRFWVGGLIRTRSVSLSTPCTVGSNSHKHMRQRWSDCRWIICTVRPLFIRKQSEKLILNTHVHTQRLLEDILTLHSHIWALKCVFKVVYTVHTNIDDIHNCTVMITFTVLCVQRTVLNSVTLSFC